MADSKDEKKIYGILTEKDISQINEKLPKEISIKSTKGQDAKLISQISPKVQIRIIGDNEKESLYTETYTGSELSQVINYFEDNEKNIAENENWSTLDKLVYIYSKFIVLTNSIELKDSNDNSNLKCLITRTPDSEGYARLYKEQLDRLGIPCKIEQNYDASHTWNVIEIEGKQYPVDLGSDAITSHKAGYGNLLIHNFGKNSEFYGSLEHAVYDPKTEQAKNEKLIKDTNLLDKESVQKSLNKVSEYIGKESQRNLQIIRESKIPLKLNSKELSNNFKNNIIDSKSLEEVEELNVKITDNNIDTLKQDISTIAVFYPEVLDKVKFTNSSSAKVNMQALVDYLIDSKYTKEQLNQKINSKNEKPENIIPVNPLSITIESSNEEDFNIDFSRIPKVEDDPYKPVDRLDINGPGTNNTIKLKNTGSKPIKFSSIIGTNISDIDLTGFDVSTLNLISTSVTGLTLKGRLTTNVDRITGFNKIKKISLDNIPESEFNVAVNKFEGHDFSINHQSLAGRHILRELGSNSELSRISIHYSSLDNLEGLDDLDGRLTLLNLQCNDLGPNQNKQIVDFIKNNPVNEHLEYYVSSNSKNTNAINSIIPNFSYDSFDFIKEYSDISGTKFDVLDKEDAINYLLWSQRNIPIYINDAKLIRNALKIDSNPMMIKDSDISTFDFEDSDIRDGKLLLSKDQIEQLLAQGKVVPQNILIKIDTVKDLSLDEINDLQARMSTVGMNIVGVQSIDERKQNGHTQIAPYTIDEYKEIRNKIDILIRDIDITEPDIDKFAVIYQRLSDSIDYDHFATKHNSKAEAIYYADVVNTSRNLCNGLKDGTCVCAGYSDILRNALDMVGIESRYVQGLAYKDRPDSGHAWNQVLLDDGTGSKKWYYTDLTWDGPKLKGTSATRNSDINYTLKGELDFTRASHNHIDTRKFRKSSTK